MILYMIRESAPGATNPRDDSLRMSTIQPSIRLIDLCGPGHAFNPRVPDNATRWVFESPAIADASTGNLLTAIGEMPVLCHAGAVREDALALLRDMGLVIEAELVTYIDAADRRDKLRHLAERGLKIIDQHAQPDRTLHPGVSWIDPSLLTALNNKANLSRWVPAHHVPAREIRTLASLPTLRMQHARFPLVVKVVTEESCGAGVGVRIIRDPSELDAVMECFAACDQVIVEEYLAMHRNLCVNYAIFADGRIEYLGATHQIIDNERQYVGNWLEPLDVPMDALVQAGYEIMRRAWQAGYRGFAGFDAAVAADGSFCIYDLNFRFNGSTVPLLLYDALARRTGLSVAKRAAWKHSGSFAAMLTALRRAVEHHQMIPFGVFDPTASRDHDDAVPRISALLFGASREEIAEKECVLDSLGFYRSRDAEPRRAPPGQVR